MNKILNQNTRVKTVLNSFVPNLFKIAAFCSIAALGLFSCQSGQKESEKLQTPFVGPAHSDDYSHLTDIQHYREWSTYNVHDPSVIKSGEYYYMYSTDAIWWPQDAVRESDTIATGNIQVRRSRDLVNWEFLGWALDSIPEEAFAHVKEASGGTEPGGIWAPYIQKHNDIYRLYYSVSVFGANTSCIGLATSSSPKGPWKHEGLVVKTFKTDPVNAIDPSIVVDVENGKYWMHYGSYFGGLYVVELDPVTGLTKVEDDLGKMVANRANSKDKIIEAPEAIYNPNTKLYYLFVSYDALFTHYNVRVGRSENPEGPFYDMYGNDLADTANNYPVLTYAYRFGDHPGWAGVGHCAVINDNGEFFMVHQGRLAPDNLMMVLHVRKIFWTSDGWPVVSPERYAGVPQTDIDESEIEGEWEFMHLAEVSDTVNLWQGQIPPGGWHYSKTMFNNARTIALSSDGSIKGKVDFDNWRKEGEKLYLRNSEGKEVELIISRGWDWESGKETLVFTGIGNNGFSMWGKQIRDLDIRN